MKSEPRALATWLAALSAEELAKLLRERGVSPATSWDDCFDAAEGLLDAASLDRALTTLARPAVRALAAAATEQGTDAAADVGDRSARAALDALGLLREDGRPFRAVAERLEALLAERPDAIAEQPAAADPPVPDVRARALLAEHAAAATRAVTDIVALSADQPLAVTGGGAVTAVDRRRLVDTHVVRDGDELDDLLRLAADAGLLVPVDRAWRVAVAGDAWLPGSTTQRWQRVAVGWRDGLPAALRTADGGYLPPARWEGAVPLDPDWPATVAAVRARAVRWGLYDRDGAEPEWTRGLRRGAEPDAAALTALLPAEIDSVYLQADLTAIAPGPLRSAVDLRLRTMAVRESQAQASTYRFTADSLAAAVAGGEDATSLRDFLSTISLTGIPQPLDYLIAQTAARHGLVRVGTDATTGRTRVTGADPQVLRTIAVDQSLRSIGLMPDGAALTSRVSRDAVFWTLADARYPVVAVDAAGQPEPLARRHAPVPAAPPADPAAPLLPLAHALLAHSAADADAAWLRRELDQAVRTRSEITVTVRMPDGGEREFTLAVTGLGGGRLRGRDRAADIERTLPVASIVGVRPG
nr:helicase-associated domain-containing protein [Microbacterium bovistercoris]